MPNAEWSMFECSTDTPSDEAKANNNVRCKSTLGYLQAAQDRAVVRRGPFWGEKGSSVRLLAGWPTCCLMASSGPGGKANKQHSAHRGAVPVVDERCSRGRVPRKNCAGGLGHRPVPHTSGEEGGEGQARPCSDNAVK